MMSLLFRRKRLVFSDNNFQDYEFTRLNTHVKKEMSEELTIILSNNYYWNQFLEIIGNYCPRKMRLAASYKLFLFTYLFSFVFSYFLGAAEGVFLTPNSR